jgi:hypothetical protein
VYKFLNHKQEKAIIIISKIHQRKAHRWNLFLRQKGDKENRSHTSNNLVVEETDALLDEGDAKLLSGLEDRGVVLASSRSGNVLDT